VPDERTSRSRTPTTVTAGEVAAAEVAARVLGATAPACWWWQVAINDVRRLPRVREVFPVVARICEAHGVPSPGHLPAPLIAAVPDLHWLVHAGPRSCSITPTRQVSRPR
jgi:hypothetical protein